MNKYIPFIIVFLILCLVGIVAAESKYGYVGEGSKFITINTSIGPAYINVQYITSVRITNVTGREGMTEILIMGDYNYYTKDSINEVLTRIIER